MRIESSILRKLSLTTGHMLQQLKLLSKQFLVSLLELEESIRTTPHGTKNKMGIAEEFYSVIADRTRTIYPYRLNKEFSLRF